MKNNQKGITLIALVVTIIVLLILAGVSIAMLTGEGGILGNARTSAEQTKLMNAADEITMTAAETASTFMKEKYVDGKEGSVYTAENQELNDAIDDAVNALQTKFTKSGITLSGTAATGYTLKSTNYQTSGTVTPGSGRMTWSAPIATP